MENRDSAFRLPLLVHYRPSRRLCAVQLSAYAGACACLLLAGLPAWPRFLLLVILLSGGLLRGRELWRDRVTGQPPCLILNSADEWRLSTGTGVIRQLRLQPQCFVHPWVIVLRFRDEDERKLVFLLDRDNTGSEVLRRLRVRLRFGLLAA